MKSYAGSGGGKQRRGQTGREPEKYIDRVMYGGRARGRATNVDSFPYLVIRASLRRNHLRVRAN